MGVDVNENAAMIGSKRARVEAQVTGTSNAVDDSGGSSYIIDLG